MELFSKTVAFSPLRVRDLEEKVMGLLGGVSARLPLRDLIMPHNRDGLHLWEHDSRKLKRRWKFGVKLGGQEGIGGCRCYVC